MPFNLDFDYPARFERYYHVRSDAPLEELWRLWLRYVDFHYLRAEWPGHSDDEMLQVSTFVRQANEFRVASSTTSLLTRPLLIYYSLHNLAKAFLLLKGGEKPSGYHGLAKASVGATLLETSAQVNNGLFLSLACTLGSPLPIGKTLTIRDFAKNTIELEQALSDYFQEESYYVTPQIKARFGGHLAIDFSAVPGTESELLERVRATTTLLDDFDAAVTSGIVTLAPKMKLPDHPALTDAVIDLLRDRVAFPVFASDKYFVKLAPPEQRVDPAGAYLGCMFLLSSLVRYSPEALERFVGTKATSNEWFLGELCTKAERVYPNLLLNALNTYPLKIGPGTV